MKNTGLSNRFSKETRWEWEDWHQCMVCGENRWDALHHIMSPSSIRFVEGKHNTSILNSSPIHNFKCHIGNEGWLRKNEGYLLKRTLSALERMGYELSDKDEKFLNIYKSLYEN